MGIKECGRPAGDGNVGIGDEMQAAARAHPVDGHDDGHVQLPAGQEGQLGIQVFSPGETGAGQVFGVGTRAESTARSRNDDAPQASVAPRFGPQRFETEAEVPVEGVKTVGPVEGDGKDAAGPFAQEVVRHRRALARHSGLALV